MRSKLHQSTSEMRPDVALALREKAAQCRRLAASIADRQTVEALHVLADEYERDANRSTR